MTNEISEEMTKTLKEIGSNGGNISNACRNTKMERNLVYEALLFNEKSWEIISSGKEA
jgi:hypothetical protein